MSVCLRLHHVHLRVLLEPAVWCLQDNTRPGAAVSGCQDSNHLPLLQCTAKKLQRLLMIAWRAGFWQASALQCLSVP